MFILDRFSREERPNLKRWGRIMKIVVAGLVVALSLGFVLQSDVVGGGKAKHTISDVMKTAMKGGLCAKVAGGKASDAEKAQLVELFTALAANKPPKGDEASWKEKTGALLTAAKAGDGAALKKAANCGGCHGAHKP